VSSIQGAFSANLFGRTIQEETDACRYSGSSGFGTVRKNADRIADVVTGDRLQGVNQMTKHLGRHC
jgi:hypothetical protein